MMTERRLSEKAIELFHQYLLMEEKSDATVEKYLRDTHAFCVYIGTDTVTKEAVVSYKKHLQERGVCGAFRKFHAGVHKQSA